MTYRVGNHQPQNVYRDDAYIGVMFTAEDAALVVEALNGRPSAECPYCAVGLEAECPWHSEPPDPCTGCTAAKGDPDCPVHHGRKPRGPKPPPLGEGCICDGSGRTCPRHGAVI